MSGFDRWKQDIDSADSRWDEHDCNIRRIVSEYNRYLKDTPGYADLDWKIVKAIIWVETGALNPLWGSNPMQIGNPGDLGLAALLGSKEGGNLIIPPDYRNSLSIATVRSSAIHNIRAGVGYLLMKAARFDIRNVPDPDATIFEVTVKPGDSLERIARAQGSTVEMMRTLNPGVQTLRPGQVLKCRKAAMRKVITGWRFINAQTVPTLYNGGGDSNYGKKLAHALEAVNKEREVTACD